MMMSAEIILEPRRGVNIAKCYVRLDDETMPASPRRVAEASVLADHHRLHWVVFASFLTQQFQDTPALLRGMQTSGIS